MAGCTHLQIMPTFSVVSAIDGSTLVESIFVVEDATIELLAAQVANACCRKLRCGLISPANIRLSCDCLVGKSGLVEGDVLAAIFVDDGGLLVNERVEIHGMEEVTHLNGKEAQCERWDWDTGCWIVTLRPPLSDLWVDPPPFEQKSIAVSNLKPLPWKGVMGIDFGNIDVTSVAWEDTNARTLAVTAAYVASTNDSSLVGAAAKEYSSHDLTNTVFGAKNLLARKAHEPEIQAYLAHLPFRTTSTGEDDELQIVVTSNGQNVELSPEEVIIRVLRNLKVLVEMDMGKEVQNCVAAVPSAWNYIQRQAMKKCFELAGFRVLRVMIEPMAIVMARGLDMRREHSRCAVCQFEPGSFDFTILDIEDGISEVLCTLRDLYSHIAELDVTHSMELVQGMVKGIEKQSVTDLVIVDNGGQVSTIQEALLQLFVSARVQVCAPAENLIAIGAARQGTLLCG